ncbi:DUF968 domain-containing protein [Vibrio vulnificus]|uniref:DUF968 domain-containing protein n=1 Tax=Vibrio vulnificus TaxID=672 RepID=UPI0030EBC4FE
MLISSVIPLSDLGITIIKTGEHTASMKELDGRALIQPVPCSLAQRQDGPIDAVLLAATEKDTVRRDSTLLPFFTHPDVDKLFDPIEKHVDRIPRCQAKSDDCNHNLLTVKIESGGAVRLCWYHDLHRDEVRDIESKAAMNLIVFRSNVVSVRLHGRVVPLTMPELCWWAVRNDVYHALPQPLLTKVFSEEAKSRRVGLGAYKDTDARYTQRESRELLEVLAKPVLKLSVDEDPPLLYMRKPKLTTYTSEAYLAFVRKLPCVVNGPATECDPVVAHHLILHGEGKMGGKAHDLFTFPLRASEHRKFHDDPAGWEARHGTQLLHVKNTLRKALDVGAIG